MRTRDGEELIGNNPAEIVADLHSRTLERSANDRAFMRDMQARALLQTGRRVRCSSFEVFIADLIEAGLLIDDDDKQPLAPRDWKARRKAPNDEEAV